MTSVGFVVAHYHENYLQPTLRAIEKLSLSLQSPQRVLVSNSKAVYDNLVAGNATIGAHDQLLLHDNSGMEFGAYQVGVDQLSHRVDSDWTIVANDTFCIHKNFASVTRGRLLAELANYHEFPVIIGHIDSLPRSYQLAGFRTNRWIRSNIFAINRAALSALKSRLYYPELDALINDSFDQETFFSDSLDPVLRHHLAVWLFRTEPGAHWYGSEPLSSENLHRMIRKARSILYEKYLSAALDHFSAEFVDLNRLSIPQKIIRKLDDKLFDFASQLSFHRPSSRPK
jgi:hypothetical protein